MHKKLMLACMAIAAFAAFVVAPAASASPVLTEKTSNGVIHVVPVGASIKGTNTGNTKFTSSLVTVECSHAEVKGTVTANTGSTIAGEVPLGGASFTNGASGTECSSGAGPTLVSVLSKLCLDTVKGTDNVTVSGCGSNVKFTLNITGFAHCVFRTASVTGTYVTNADATVNVSEQPASLVEGGFFCPSSGKLDMDFDLTTTDGTTLFIS